MTSDPRQDVVARQYERWVYPEPIQDLPGWLASNWQWFDPSHAHRLFWPDRPYPAGLQILVAGCGTNQAAVIAYTNPSARVVAIDVSEASLGHHQALKERYGLRNLELHHLPIEEVGRLDLDFDLIMSTGVLHHLADPQVGMNALAACLRQDGVLALMLYAQYGRIGVEIMETVFADLGLRQDEESVGIVRDALAVLPPAHPLQSYLPLAPDIGFDAGLVDTFLHGRARNYTVDECLSLVDTSGLVFQDWFLKSSYEPVYVPGNAFFEAVSRLPDRTRWSAMERVYTQNGCHFFTACRADRPRDSYAIDLNSEHVHEYMPMFRYRCQLDGDAILKQGWRQELTADQARVAQLFDGQRTIGDIIAASEATTALQRDDVITFVRSLWQQDYISLGLHSPS